jgi:subtilase family serine protease
MKKILLLLLALFCGVALLGAAPATAAPAPSLPTRTAHACAVTTAPGYARCFAAVRPGSAGHYRTTRTAAAPPTGYGPADLASAYGLGPVRNNGAGRTIAIVDAFDNPRAEADLAVYRRTFGLPACTTGNGCFRKVNQRGTASPLPAGDPGWGVEIALDLQAASAACPRCRLLLVEGDDPQVANLAAAVDTAVRLHATVVSNSYGLDEWGGMRAYQASYNHPGVAITVSSGDFGFTAAQFPAVLRTVVAVGGTALRRTTAGRGWSESAWFGSGSGCSAWIAKPSWQKDPNCQMRTTADVSAVADPDTGLAVYDTYGLGSDNGWIVVGGTSASAPFVAGVIALGPAPGRYATAQRFYSRPKTLRDVVGGSNGFCGGDYLCTGLPGYDAPTGLGTPKGIVSVS